MKKKSGKLVRDKIPSILEKHGVRFSVRTLSRSEYQKALAAKLVEEALEFEETPSLEELADVLEVVRALLGDMKKSWVELETARTKKRRARGAFKKRLYLERATRPNR